MVLLLYRERLSASVFEQRNSEEKTRFCTSFPIGISPSSAISLGQTRPEILVDLWYNRKSLIRREDVLEKQLGNGCTWINLDLDKLKKLEDLSEIYGLDKETIEYALDRNERAHMDYHRENGTVTFIYNVLNLKRIRHTTKLFP